MHKEIQKTNRKSQFKVNLPNIAHSKSVPIVQHHLKKQDFNLRIAHQSMPMYNPNKDKFLNHFFEKHHKNRNSAAKDTVNYKQARKSAKTLPTQEKINEQKLKTKRQKLMTLQSQKMAQKQSVTQISKQQFGSFMQIMRDKLTKR